MQTDRYRYEPCDPFLEKPTGVKIGMREQLDWIKRQLEYFNLAERYKTRFDLKRGEIYEFDWGINVNAEFSNRHYGVVLQDSDPKNPLVIVCPLKTNHHGAHPKSDVDLGYIKELNSTKPSIAVINQIRTIDKMRLYTKNCIGKTQQFAERSEISIDEQSIVRLEDYKVKMILNSYLLMIMGEHTD